MIEAEGGRRRVLELFAGIGGFAAAWPEADVVAAIDINRFAEATYRRNHRHRFLVREIDSLSDAELSSFGADLWWLSPPCQPYSHRGHRRDVDDPRARPLLRLVAAIPACRPTAIGLENVVGFADSQAHARLQQVLQECGYHVASIEICPSQLGWPNRRPRFYLLASQQPLPAWGERPVYRLRLEELVEQAPADLSHSLWLNTDELTRLPGLDRVDPDVAESTTACFAGSYGKTLLHAGSYLFRQRGYRRFTPREIARLMGFPDSFLIDHLPTRTAWKLLGNSLSLPAVRYALSPLGCSAQVASPRGC